MADPIPDKSLREEDKALIGQLVVWCAGIEQLAVMALTVSMDAEFESVDLAFRRMSYAGVLHTLAVLAPTFLPESDLRARWLAWIETAQDIGRRRNEIVHTLWSSLASEHLEGLRRAPFREVRMQRDELRKATHDAGYAMTDGVPLLLDLMKFRRENQRTRAF